MFDALVTELSERYGLGGRGRELFALLVGHVYNDRRGGFDGFLEGFHQQGYGELASSWTDASAAPRSINATEVGTVFGQGLLNDWGGRLGVSRATLAAAIAGVLPQLVAALAPARPGDGIAGRPAAAPAAPGFDAIARSDLEYRGSGHRATETSPRDFSVIPGVDGLVARTRDASPEEPAAADPYGLGSVVPSREPIVNAPRDVRPPPEAALRRAPSADMQSPTALDPAEQRIADMAAAMAPARASASSAAGVAAERRPDTWRPAVHPPKKRGFAWLFWLLLLAALAAGGWYAWQLGLLDPYIQQYGLPIQTSRSAS